MTTHLYTLARHIVISCVLIAAVAASAGTVYENGPINGTENSWTLNLNYPGAGDSFTVSAGVSTIGGVAFGAWLIPGDTFNSVDVTITSLPFGGQILFDQQVHVITSNCSANGKGFLVCEETAFFLGPGLALNNGTYYLELENALGSSPYDPIGWDQNDGVGCSSPGCPSQGYIGIGTIPSESFTVLSGVAGGSTPEPGSLVLFATGLAGLAAVLRRKLF